MIYLLDTNAFRDLMKGEPKLRAKLMGLVSTERVTICPIVWGEIRFGIERLPNGRRKNDLHAGAIAWRALVPCEATSEIAGEHYATLRILRQQNSIGAEDNDLWIVATALALGATLVSRDKAIQLLSAVMPGLMVEDWTL